MMLHLGFKKFFSLPNSCYLISNKGMLPLTLIQPKIFIDKLL